MSEICNQQEVFTDNTQSTKMLNVYKNNKKRCAICHYDGERGALEIHHIDGNHDNNSKQNLLVLCTICHREAHAKQRSKNKILVVDNIKKETNPNAPHCNHCGYINEYKRTKNPIRCPRCGNPYNTTPKRKHTQKRLDTTPNKPEQIKETDPNLMFCNHCEYIWTYKGKSNHYLTCPRCYYKVKRHPRKNNPQTNF